VRSRARWRPSLPEACRNLSTSSGVRYSCLRLEASEIRRGGRGEPGSIARAALMASYCAGRQLLSHLRVLARILPLLLFPRFSPCR